MELAVHRHSSEQPFIDPDLGQLHYDKVVAALKPGEIVVWMGRASPLAIIWFGAVNIIARSIIFTFFSLIFIVILKDKLGSQNFFPTSFYHFNKTAYLDIQILLIVASGVLAAFFALTLWDSFKIVKAARQHVFAVTNVRGLTLVGDHDPISLIQRCLIKLGFKSIHLRDGGAFFLIATTMEMMRTGIDFITGTPFTASKMPGMY
ncbi:MAG: hypothetical protein NW215_04665 [Hyphomicrobiales bacterium]|nr:hypothetical protein [Hyphomicrobiales bacterium]